MDESRTLQEIEADEALAALPDVGNGFSKERLEELKAEGYPLVREEAPSDIPDLFKEHPEEEDDEPSDLTEGDAFLAARFVAEHSHEARYVTAWKSPWITWAGTNWSTDDDLEVHRMADKTAKRLWAESRTNHELRKLASHASTAGGIRAMLELASARLVILPSQLDTNHMLFNTILGTIDLETGLQRGHRREDYITKMAATAPFPSATCPTWDKFLVGSLVTKTLEPDPDLVAYIWRLFGYWLTGLTTEHVFAIFHGDGANGKTTLVESLMDLLGTYAHAVSPELLLTTSKNVEPEMMSLFGKRLATAKETNPDRKFNEAMVKNITGGGTISGRGIYEKPWHFIATHKLLLETNHKPEITGTDEGIRRRVNLIPFYRVFARPEQDTQLLEKLKEEFPGALNRMVQGCLDWQNLGELLPPPSVVEATEEYLLESDEMRRWIHDRCNIGDVFKDAWTPVDDLYQSYCLWTHAEGIGDGLPQNKFGKALAGLGYHEARKGNPQVRCRHGIAIREVS